MVTLTFLRLRGVARHGVLDIRGSVSPGYVLAGSRREVVTVWQADGRGRKLRVLTRLRTSTRHSRGGAPFGTNDFATTLPLRVGKRYTIVITVGAQPLNAGADAPRFTVRA